MKRSRLRAHLVPVLVALACVVLAAVGLRVSEPPDQQIRHGVLARPVTVDDGTVTVDRLQVGDSLLENGEIAYHTPGMFVVIDVEAAATGSRPLALTGAQLVSGSRTYRPFSTLAGVTAVPGFASALDLVFEVDPSRIDGLTIELWQSEIVSGYPQRVRVPLGVTAGNAGQWRSRAHVPVVEPDVHGSTRVIS